MSDFASRLRAAMDQAGIRAYELAARSGAPRSAISQYLSGKNLPGPARLEALADALSVSPAVLQADAAPQPEPPPVKNISTAAAARCMGKSDQFVRVGLQRGLLPFGTAVPGRGRHYNYYISPIRFRDYVGADQFNAFFGLASS